MLSSLQFHEMTRGEFESQRGTYFHGHPTGNFNWEDRGPGFHVGTQRAAEEAVIARAGTKGGLARYAGGVTGGPTFPAQKIETDIGDGWKKVTYEPHPEHVRGGRIASPMVNWSISLGSYGKGNIGDMHDSGDAMANGRVAAIKTRGQTMRQGIFYRNMAEDAGSVSAVLPSRQSFKTHEDLIIEARARGARVPDHVLAEYPRLGQQRLF